jgi:murein DD-endopeptidase MepM/ murein hydrolase activator NlpD
MTAPVFPHARASAVALALIALVMIAVLVSACVPGGAPAAAREPPTTVTASSAPEVPSALAVPAVPAVPSAFSRAVPSPVSASDARAPLARVSWLERAPAAALAADGTPTGPPLGSLEVTGPYSAPPHRYGSGHRGIDLAATAGMAVVAPASGTVSFAGAVVDRPVVSVRVDERTVYSLEPVSSGLAAGDPVAAGAVLGEVAGGGHCLQECVHLGVRVGGEYVNPLRYLRGRPVLLPW